MSESANQAVFLSYASQDAAVARRICEALRAGSVEVWLDTDGGLEHGDEWDAKIRRQIEVDPKNWTGGIVKNRTPKQERSICPRNDVSTVPS